ncbi:MAG: hypothetical protein V9H25_06565 [Candidatus Competibacter sp.]
MSEHDLVEMEIVKGEDGYSATMRVKKHHATHDPEIDELLETVKRLSGASFVVVNDETGQLELKYR